MDYRKKNNEEIFEIKKGIIRLYKEGKKTKEIQNIYGMHIDTIRRTIRLYKQNLNNINALKPKRKGRPKNLTRLSPDEMKTLENEIVDNMNHDIFSRTRIRQIVKERFGKKITIQTVDDFLNDSGITLPKMPQIQCYLPGRGDFYISIEKLKHNMTLISAYNKRTNMFFKVYNNSNIKEFTIFEKMASKYSCILANFLASLYTVYKIDNRIDSLKLYGNEEVCRCFDDLLRCFFIIHIHKMNQKQTFISIYDNPILAEKIEKSIAKVGGLFVKNIINKMRYFDPSN